MKIFCATAGVAMPKDSDLNVLLYGPTKRDEHGRLQGSAGKAAKADILRAKLSPSPRAWDLLSLALSVVTADLAAHREKSPDGWTRQIALSVGVSDAPFWVAQRDSIEAMLRFLSTDIWMLDFVADGPTPAAPHNPVLPDEDSVVLLSGGLDSLIGAIDLVASGARPMAVSHVVRGDGQNQQTFASRIGGGLRHLSLNHNAAPPGVKEPSQRARSIIFLAFAVLACTTLARYHRGDTVPLYVCENGFIALNPPLTGMRVGSLSTRTAHPEYLGRFQELLDAAGIRVRIVNPYALATKGEMLAECADQALLERFASQSVSCGRYRVFGYQHCGRCVPCQVRRASFVHWGRPDHTDYRFENLGRAGNNYAHFDDVRAVAMAVAAVSADGLARWAGPALSYPRVVNRLGHLAVIGRGLGELEALHQEFRHP